jgi:hypothetical protein
MTGPVTIFSDEDCTFFIFDQSAAIPLGVLFFWFVHNSFAILNNDTMIVKEPCTCFSVARDFNKQSL